MADSDGVTLALVLPAVSGFYVPAAEPRTPRGLHGRARAAQGWAWPRLYHWRGTSRRPAVGQRRPGRYQPYKTGCKDFERTHLGTPALHPLSSKKSEWGEKNSSKTDLDL